MTDQPLAIDLFCGLFGWGAGLAAEGWRVVGFDLEDMYPVLGVPRPDGCQLVIQDVLSLHGAQFREASLIVASPPCQRYSWMAMPWTLAKAKAAAIRADTTGAELERLNRLFNACFRIQAQASLAAGRHIPLIVENVRGAQPWVGRARWSFGSYFLWGDVPALMPIRSRSQSNKIAPAVNEAIRNGQSPARWTNPSEWGRKGAGAGAEWFDANLCVHPSKSPARKAASAMIAKIPAALARHIAAVFRP